MDLLARAIVWIQFKLGIYQVRQITRIERGGLVISRADSRHQPDGGIRYELSSDEWFLYSYRFFPRSYRGVYDEEFLTRERYYDIYANRGPAEQEWQLFTIFKNGHTTGYFIQEYRHSANPNLIGSFHKTRSYYGIHINQLGTSSYKDTTKNSIVKEIYFAETPMDAAICMLADDGDFEKVKIDLASLKKDCEDESLLDSPGSCILHSKLTRLLQDCNHADLYIGE